MVATQSGTARQVEATRNRLLQMNQRFENLQKAASDESVAHLAGLYLAYQTAHTAATAAAGDLFADEPLPEIGSDVWRRLWEAARLYSQERAYMDLPFPVTGGGARCVLCQQELDADASVRLDRFERFVKDETKRSEEAAEKAYRSHLHEMNIADVSVGEIDAVVALVRDDFNDIELSKSVRFAAVRLKWRLRAILRNHSGGNVARIPPTAEAWPSSAITAHGVALSNRINGLLAEDQSVERKKMREEFDGLGDRQWLSIVQDDVIAEIDRRKKRAVLNALLKDTTTNQITVKSSEIAEQLVTNALCARFSKEIEKARCCGVSD